MTQYLDSSALLAVLMEEPAAARVGAALQADRDWITGRHTFVEVRRAVAGSIATHQLVSAREAFAGYWARTTIVELDDPLCSLAADLAERTRLRTLDALHLAAAQRGGGMEIVMLTLDRRLWRAARSIGMSARDVAGFADAAGVSP